MAETGSGPLRVLVLDDDPAYRRIVTKTFERIVGAQVVGSVATVDEVKRVLTATAVDLISMDVVLAEGSSLELLGWLRKNHPKVKTVLLTAGQEKRASQSIDAILLGASFLVLKPSCVGAPQKLFDDLQKIVTGVRPTAQASALPKSYAPALSGPRELVAVGASTGGPAVLMQFLKDLPQNLGVPILVTQHLAAEHTQALVVMLNYPGGRKATLAQHGQPIRPNEVIVAGNDRHLLITRQAGQLFVNTSEAAPENFCRPAVDPMFRSVADVCGAASIGVIMTGMGSDGGKGAKALRAAGAAVVVQDEATSVVWGMPGAAVALNAVNQVVAGPLLGRSVAGLINNLSIKRSQEVRP